MTPVQRAIEFDFIVCLCVRRTWNERWWLYDVESCLNGRKMWRARVVFCRQIEKFIPPTFVIEKMCSNISIIAKCWKQTICFVTREHSSLSHTITYGYSAIICTVKHTVTELSPDRFAQYFRLPCAISDRAKIQNGLLKQWVQIQLISFLHFARILFLSILTPYSVLSVCWWVLCRVHSKNRLRWWNCLSFV